jgi:hypothetical protein
MALGEPVNRSDAYLKHRAEERLLQVAVDLRLGRILGTTPYQIRAWEREYQRYHGTPPDERGRWHRLRTDLRDARIGSPLPAPDYLNLGRLPPRLYQEKVGYNFGMGHELTWRTVGYHWDVGRPEDRNRTWFTLTVNADGAPEFHAPGHRGPGDPYDVFPADPPAGEH